MPKTKFKKWVEKKCFFNLVLKEGLNFRNESNQSFLFSSLIDLNLTSCWSVVVVIDDVVVVRG